MTNKPAIITHRGLDPDIVGFPAEGSLAAFKEHLRRGYGIEFDLRATKDGDLIVLHSRGLLQDNQSTPTLKEILSEIGAYPSVSLSALHYKGDEQNSHTTDLLIDALETSDPSRLIIFDVTIETALRIKARLKDALLAPSVAHPYDIARYGAAVHGTLMNLDEACSRKDIFRWVWLDEWDRADKDGKTKSLYSAETFARLRENGFKIALVTPELHATSPNLLGGEAHPDAETMERLKARISEILSLRPDALCTDHPDMVKNLWN